MLKDELIQIPTYVKLKNIIKEQIETGELEQGSKLPSEREMTDIYGVSRMTINKSITSLVEEGYLYRKMGLGTFVGGVPWYTNGHHGPKTGNIGLVIQRGSVYAGEYFYSKILHGAEHEAVLQDMNVFVITVGSSMEHRTSLKKAIQEKKLDGLVIIGKISNQIISELHKKRVPMVLVDYVYRPAPIPTVLMDNHKGIEQAINYLTKAGHRRIAFIRGPKFLPSVEERYNAYIDCLKKHDIPINKNIIISGDLHPDSGYLVAQYLWNLSPRPTAILACNDEMAFGVIRYYTELGISIPKDISVIGFDDIDLARHIHPPLSTVKVFNEEMGQKAIQILLDASAFSKGKTPTTIRVPTELVIRASAGPAPRE